MAMFSIRPATVAATEKLKNAVITALKPGDVFLDVGAHLGYFSIVAARVDVEVGHTVKGVQELGRDLSDGDVVDIDLLLADEIQQEIERPLVGV